MRPEDERPGDWREARRQRALELADAGWKGARIAEALGVSKGAVSQWLSRREAQGRMPSKPSHEQDGPPQVDPRAVGDDSQHAIPGRGSLGFSGATGTGTRVAAILRWQFGVHYNPHYVAALLKRLRWSVQFPKKRAIQRDEEAIVNAVQNAPHSAGKRERSALMVQI